MFTMKDNTITTYMKFTMKDNIITWLKLLQISFLATKNQWKTTLLLSLMASPIFIKID